MSVFVNQLIERQHAEIAAYTRPRMVARRIGHESGTCLYSAFPSFVNVLAIGWDTAGVELPRGWNQPRPDYGCRYVTEDRDQALAAATGYLFTGAAYVLLEWHEQGTWHQEVYVAEVEYCLPGRIVTETLAAVQS